MTTTRITAIVVVHGAPADTVGACVTSLLDSVDVDVHVVLVDNASPDGGAACTGWASDDRVSLIRSVRNDGFAAGVNQGLQRRRSGDLIWLLNDDADVEPDCIARCVVTLQSEPLAVAVAPRVMLAGERDRIDSIGVVMRPNGEAFNAHIGQAWTGQVADRSRLLGPCFSAALFRSDAFESQRVGPIDERYRLYYEDIDWALRAQLAGLHTLASTTAVVWHQHAASTRLLGEPSRYELVQRNLLVCATKNLTWPSVIRVWANRCVVHAKGLVTGPLRPQRIRSLVRAMWAAPSAIAARRTVASQRAVDDKALFAFSEGLSPQFSADTYRSTPDSAG